MPLSWRIQLYIWNLKAKFWLLAHGIHIAPISLLIYSWWALYMIEFTRECFVFFGGMKRARKLALSGQAEEERKLLQRLSTATLPLLNAKAKSSAGFRLGQLLLESRRYGEAVDQFRGFLKSFGKKLDPSIQASVRKSLAEALDATGDLEGAAKERATAMQILETIPGKKINVLTYVTLAELAQAARRFDEEARYLKAALDAPIPPAFKLNPNHVRQEMLAKLTAASFQSGLPDEAIRYAREALEVPEPAPFWRWTAHRLLMVALDTVGDSESAMRQGQLAIEVANLNPGMVAIVKAYQSVILRDQGDLDGAGRLCDEAASDSGATRNAACVAAENHLVQGSYAAARDANQRARGATPLLNVGEERRMLALFDSMDAAIAVSEAEFAGGANLEEALRAYQVAALELGRADRIGVIHEALGTYLFALLGRAGEAREKAAFCLQQMEARPGDITLRRVTLFYVGRTYWRLGEAESARDLFETYAQVAKPVSRPAVHYYLGLYHAAQGDMETARAEWTKGAALGFDTLMVRECAKKLSESDAQTLAGERVEMPPQVLLPASDAPSGDKSLPIS